MFFAHELHPFSRTERFSVLLCYLCWAFFITCVFEQVTEYALAVQGHGMLQGKGSVKAKGRSAQKQRSCGHSHGSNRPYVRAYSKEETTRDSDTFSCVARRERGRATYAHKVHELFDPMFLISYNLLAAYTAARPL